MKTLGSPRPAVLDCAVFKQAGLRVTRTTEVERSAKTEPFQGAERESRAVETGVSGHPVL